MCGSHQGPGKDVSHQRGRIYASNQTLLVHHNNSRVAKTGADHICADQASGSAPGSGCLASRAPKRPEHRRRGAGQPERPQCLGAPWHRDVDFHSSGLQKRRRRPYDAEAPIRELFSGKSRMFPGCAKRTRIVMPSKGQTLLVHQPARASVFANRQDVEADHICGSHQGPGKDVSPPKRPDICQQPNPARPITTIHGLQKRGGPYMRRQA